jgi:hypothetical protein
MIFDDLSALVIHNHRFASDDVICYLNDKGWDAYQEDSKFREAMSSYDSLVEAGVIPDRTAEMDPFFKKKFQFGHKVAHNQNLDLTDYLPTHSGRGCTTEYVLQSVHDINGHNIVVLKSRNRFGNRN